MRSNEPLSLVDCLPVLTAIEDNNDATLKDIRHACLHFTVAQIYARLALLERRNKIHKVKCRNVCYWETSDTFEVDE